MLDCETHVVVEKISTVEQTRKQLLINLNLASALLLIIVIENVILSYR